MPKEKFGIVFMCLFLDWTDPVAPTLWARVPDPAARPAPHVGTQGRVLRLTPVAPKQYGRAVNWQIIQN